MVNKLYKEIREQPWPGLHAGRTAGAPGGFGPPYKLQSGQKLHSITHAHADTYYRS